MKWRYCCKNLEDAYWSGILRQGITIDGKYFPDRWEIINAREYALYDWPINYCPFCGKKPFGVFS